MSKLYPCVYCTEDGYCKKYSDGEVTAWCVQSPCKDEKPSHADRIRAMPDEEIAEFLVMVPYCGGPTINATDGSCIDDGLRTKRQWLDWLRQEAKE